MQRMLMQRMLMQRMLMQRMTIMMILLPVIVFASSSSSASHAEKRPSIRTDPLDLDNVHTAASYHT